MEACIAGLGEQIVHTVPQLMEDTPEFMVGQQRGFVWNRRSKVHHEGRGRVMAFSILVSETLVSFSRQSQSLLESHTGTSGYVPACVNLPSRGKRSRYK